MRFNLHQRVRIACSQETGEVIARSEHVNGENQYQVRYQAGDGRATEQWWAESALTED